jgi:hypothetical protein
MSDKFSCVRYGFAGTIGADVGVSHRARFWWVRTGDRGPSSLSKLDRNRRGGVGVSNFRPAGACLCGFFGGSLQAVVRLHVFHILLPVHVSRSQRRSVDRNRQGRVGACLCGFFRGRISLHVGRSGRSSYFVFQWACFTFWDFP